MKNKSCLLPLIFITLIMIGIFSWMLIQTGTVEQKLGSPGEYVSFFKQINYALKLRGEEDSLATSVNNIDQRVTIQVESGMPSSEIATYLYAESLITSKQAFQTYLIYKGYDRTLQTGYYSFSRQMPPLEIAQHLANGTSRQAVLNIIPGWRLEQIAAQIPSLNINVTEQEFLNLIKFPPASYTYAGGIPTGMPLEGVILPGQYLLPPDADISKLMQSLSSSYENTRISIGSNVSAATFYDAVKMASIIQREAFFEDEYALMASVFYNRLNTGMLLQMDSTIQYSLGFDQDEQSWWQMNLNSEEIYFDSPFNTYLYNNLPPTPISSPSQAAIQAALSPQQSQYYFFQAKCDGSHYHNFSQTYEEHLTFNCY